MTSLLIPMTNLVQEQVYSPIAYDRLQSATNVTNLTAITQFMRQRSMTVESCSTTQQTQTLTTKALPAQPLEHAAPSHESGYKPRSAPRPRQRRSGGVALVQMRGETARQDQRRYGRGKRLFGFRKDGNRQLSNFAIAGISSMALCVGLAGLRGVHQRGPPRGAGPGTRRATVTMRESCRSLMPKPMMRKALTMCN